MVATPCASCVSTTCGSSSMRSTSSTATGTTRTSRCPSWPRGGSGGEALVLCDTNGGSLPTTSARPWPPCGSAPARNSGSIAQRHGLRRGQLVVAVQAGVTRCRLHQRLRRAGGQHRPVGGIPNLSLNSTSAPFRGPPGATDARGAPHRRAVNIAPTPAAYVGNSSSPQGGLHASAVARSADLYEHIEPNWWGTDPGRRVGDGGRSTCP